MPTTWEEVVIGKTEAHLLKRYPVSPIRARSVGTVLVSNYISELILYDDYGPVKANLFFLHLGKSSLGFKTPVYKWIQRFTSRQYYDPNISVIAKFTPEGMTEYITGTQETSDKGGKRKVIPPHRNLFLLRDEINKLLGNIHTKKQNTGMMEYLSELWDGHIESYYPRSYQQEGDVDVYCTAYLCGSTYFYEVLKKAFFTQGLGNRPLWIVEELQKPKKLPEDKVHEYVSRVLDGYINYVYRSVKCFRDRNLVGARLEAARSIHLFLNVIFGVEGRITLYNKYLEWELNKFPLILFPMTSKDIIEYLLAILETADMTIQQELLKTIENVCRKEGYNSVFDQWGSDLKWMITYPDTISGS